MQGSDDDGHSRAHEYVNDFFYFVLKPDGSLGEDAFIYCSGVNVSRFSPLTTGRHGIGSNPATRGLQLVNFGVRDLALSKGAIPRAFRGNDCAGIAPTKEDWFTDRLLIERVPAAFHGELFTYCAINLLKKITKACMLQDVQLPEKLPEPDELQAFIEDLCKRYGRQSPSAE